MRSLPQSSGQTPPLGRIPSCGRIGRRLWLWTLAMVLLNLAWRALRYGLAFPLWGDESMLAINLLDHGYTEMFQPLSYKQICPAGFLWIELTCVRLAGFSEWVLRGWPFLSGVLAVVMFCRLALRLFPARPALLAVALLSASYYPVRHGVEFKPYGPDLFWSMTLLTLGVSLLESRRSRKLWFAFASTCMVAVWCSYPSVFVAGGMLGCIAIRALRTGDRRVWLPWCLTGAVLGASFLGAVTLVANRQAAHVSHNWDAEMWKIGFPPWSAPWKIPYWLVEVHCGRMMAYPVGSRSFGSAGTFVLLVAGAWSLLRSSERERWTGLVLLSPFAMGLIAAFANRYPYGGTARTMMYLTPSICLLAGYGLFELLRSLLRPRQVPTGIRVAVAVCVVIALGGMIRDVLKPYKTVADAMVRDEVQRLLRESDASDRLIVVNAITPLPGIEYRLAGGLTISSFDYYLRAQDKCAVEFAPPVPDVVTPRSGDLVAVLHHSDKFPLPAEPVQKYLAQLRSRFGEPEFEERALDAVESLRIYRFPHPAARPNRAIEAFATAERDGDSHRRR